MIRFIRICDDAGHTVVHIRHAVLKPAENEQHNRKEQSYNFARYRFCRKTDPDSDTYQKIT